MTTLLKSDKEKALDGLILKLWEDAEKKHNFSWNDAIHIISLPLVNKTDYPDYNCAGWKKPESFQLPSKDYNMSIISYCNFFMGYTGYIRVFEYIIPAILANDKLRFVSKWVATVCWSLRTNHQYWFREYHNIPPTKEQIEFKEQFVYLFRKVNYNSTQTHFYDTDRDFGYKQSESFERKKDGYAEKEIKDLKSLINHALLELKNQCEKEGKIVVVKYDNSTHTIPEWMDS